MLLKGKTAFITGCNRGIGKEIVTLFAREGANIIACIRRENPEFSVYIRDISSKANVSVEPLYFDMSDEDSIKFAINPLIKNKTKIDILVNNAGIAMGSLLQMTSMRKLKEVFQINFFSQVLITQLISKLMIRGKSGSIINMGSIAGLENFAGYTAYGSSKAAIMFFTKTIARELSSHHIRVNTIAPGLTDTGMTGQMDEKAAIEMTERSNLNRLAKPQEIAELALFLASDKSSFITGQTIRIDGGM
ncbi:MAG: SDR family oxidoreductase [Tannerella sp.]|jgi:3-oxoacyl-[acyl-carrier protein] reductase|nr:SDR family oxidoreductase [Tannerella sp.]